MTEICERTKLHADESFSDFTAIVCIHLQDLSFPAQPKPHRDASTREQVLEQQMLEAKH